MAKCSLLVFVCAWVVVGCTLEPGDRHRDPAAQALAPMMLDPSITEVAYADPALAIRVGEAEIRMIVCSDAPSTQEVMKAAGLVITEAREAQARDPGVRIAFNPFAWTPRGGCLKEETTKTVMQMFKVVSIR